MPMKSSKPAEKFTFSERKEVTFQEDHSQHFEKDDMNARGALQNEPSLSKSVQILPKAGLGKIRRQIALIVDSFRMRCEE